MVGEFDAYHRWLGIPPAEQPPNYYRLLGLQAFEHDRDVIDGVAALSSWLAARPGVSEVRLDGQVVQFLQEGGEEQNAALLRAMIEAGFRVSESGVRRRTLRAADPRRAPTCGTFSAGSSSSCRGRIGRRGLRAGGGTTRPGTRRRFRAIAGGNGAGAGSRRMRRKRRNGKKNGSSIGVTYVVDS